LALAFALGLVMGIGALLWQRVALLAEIGTARDSAAASKTAARDAEAALTVMQERLTSTETSAHVLAAQNAQLAADLAAARSQSNSAATPPSTSSASVVRIVERSVSPASATATNPITFTVRIQGRADRVQVRIRSLTGTSYDTNVNLTKASTASGIETWRKTVPPPPAAGTYRYAPTAFKSTESTTGPSGSFVVN
ncbi:MAG TPA: hypothetical protein VF902_00430, partial [Coriobacteriia bacterium]